MAVAEVVKHGSLNKLFNVLLSPHAPYFEDEAEVGITCTPLVYQFRLSCRCAVQDVR